MMYAVIKTGSKQHKVSEGEVLSVEKLTAEKGTEVVFNEVLMVSGDNGVVVGKPFVEGAKVIGQVLEQTKGPKLLVFKKKRRTGYQKCNGHRQYLTQILVEEIVA